MSRAKTWVCDRFDRDQDLNVELAKRLFDEEVNETLDAIKSKDIVEVFDGLADVRFVLEGNEYKAMYSEELTKEVAIQRERYGSLKEFVKNSINDSSDFDVLFEAVYNLVCDEKIRELLFKNKMDLK
jgi:hypothetical protein